MKSGVGTVFLIVGSVLWSEPSDALTVDVFIDAEAGFEDAVFRESPSAFGAWPRWQDADDYLGRTPFPAGFGGLSAPNRQSRRPSPPPPAVAPPPAVPLPGAIWLALSGVAALLVGSRWGRQAR